MLLGDADLVVYFCLHALCGEQCLNAVAKIGACQEKGLEKSKLSLKITLLCVVIICLVIYRFIRTRKNCIIWKKPGDIHGKSYLNLQHTDAIYP